eukprot:1194446-Prorocentrum_minimum.AAC.2
MASLGLACARTRDHPVSNIVHASFVSLDQSEHSAANVAAALEDAAATFAEVSTMPRAHYITCTHDANRNQRSFGQGRKASHMATVRDNVRPWEIAVIFRYILTTDQSDAVSVGEKQTQTTKAAAYSALVFPFAYEAPFLTYESYSKRPVVYNIHCLPRGVKAQEGTFKQLKRETSIAFLRFRLLESSLLGLHSVVGLQCLGFALHVHRDNIRENRI